MADTKGNLAMHNPSASTPSSVASKSKKYPPLRALTPAEQQLVLDNMGLAKKLAGKMASFLCSRRRWGTKSPFSLYFEELLSAGHVGLCVAAQRYDPENERGAKFSTYSMWWIRNHMQHASADLEMRWGPVNSKTHRTREFRVDFFGDRQQEDRNTGGSRNCLDIWDSRTGEDPAPEHEVSQELLVLLSLAIDNPRWLRMLRGRIFEGKALRKMAEEEGVKKQRVQQIVAKALERLRDAPGVVSYLQERVERQRALSSVDFRGTGVVKMLA